MRLKFIEMVENIAIYGAVVSTIALGWNIYKYFQEKPKIKVDVKLGAIIYKKSGVGETKLIISIVNKGGKSIYLSSSGLRSGGDNFQNLSSNDLPCELKSGCSHDEFFDVKKLKRDREYDFGWYRDATGKMYKSKSIKKKINNYFKSEKESTKEI
jgi:hypothetical protein